ncbi:MAG: SpoIID/LytB domain-containing protein [Bacillota bacterium]
MKRWRIQLLIALVLAVALWPQLPTQATTVASSVRVGLYHDQTALPEVRLSATSGLMLAQLPSGADVPVPLYQQTGPSSWTVRPDAFRLQFGPYSSLAAANAALASLSGEKTRFVVQENDQFYVHFGAYNSAATVQQGLQATSQPGKVIGCYRVASDTLEDLSTAEGLRDQVLAHNLPASLAWMGNGWQVQVGHEGDAQQAEALLAELKGLLSATGWRSTSPDLSRSEIYDHEGRLRLSVPEMDLYLGAIGAEQQQLEDPALFTLHAGGGSKQYRGFLQLSLQPNSLYRGVLYLTVDQYLMGVLAAESWASWPAEVQKAQAITMRNWTVNSRGKHASAGFDFCTSTNCQTYKDYTGERPSTQQAVLETAGLVMTYQGQVISAFHCADGGDYTEAVENVWTGSRPTPWLVSVPELYPRESPYVQWEQRFSGEELSALLRENGISIGKVVSVQVTDYTPAGRAMGLRLVDSGGKSVTLTGETPLRLYLTLKSRVYTVQPDVPPVSVLGADGQLVQVNPSGLQVATAAGIHTLNSTGKYHLRGAASSASNNAAASGFVFKGTGYGHGVGLSQWGAYAMAKNGHSYEEILRHYFQGIELTRLGD